MFLCVFVVLVKKANFLMMGTADELPAAPPFQPMFVEDMTDKQLAHAVS